MSFGNITELHRLQPKHVGAYLPVVVQGVRTRIGMGRRPR